MSPEAYILQEFAPIFEYLLKAILAQQHPDGYLRGERDASGSVFLSEDTYSLTTHFVNALLSSGYADGDYLKRAVSWHLSDIADDRVELDQIGMNRLEVLLLVNPDRQMLSSYGQDPDLVPKMLHQLINQRQGLAYYDIEGVTPWFATLWTLKLLSSARKLGWIQEVCILEDMQTDIEAVLMDSRSGVRRPRHHQELALALHLYYVLYDGQFQDEHLELLDNLLHSSKKGLWNTRAGLLEQLPALKRYGFSANIDRQDRRHWREALVGTCYVIENLAPLREFEGVDDALNAAMHSLIDIFSSSPGDLLQSFQKDYDWTLIMCRLLIAGQAYAEGYFRGHLLSSLIDQLKLDKNNWDREGITYALRNWFEVAYSDEPQRLTLGLSGARVLRVRPKIFIPPAASALSNPRVPLPIFDTVVIKYGPHKEIKTEYHKYRHALPGTLQNFFAPMRLTHSNEENAFLVIQDLHDFDSLEEFLRKARPNAISDQLSDALLDFIWRFHGLAPGRQQRAGADLFRRLYIQPLWRYVEVVHGMYYKPAVQQHLSALQWDGFEKVEQNERQLRSMITTLYEYEHILNQFPAVHMHGDLHTRNIMIHNHAYDRSEFNFKLLDLEKFERVGDYVLDIGQLSINLKLLASEVKRSNRQPVSDIESKISLAYERTADTIGDKLFNGQNSQTCHNNEHEQTKI